LEGEEGNTYRQQYLGPTHGFMTGPAQKRVEVLHSEVAVLEVEQQSDADCDGNATEQFLYRGLVGLAHPLHQVEVYYCGGRQLYDEFGCAIGVKQE
jgi:hypothetical protein